MDPLWDRDTEQHTYDNVTASVIHTLIIIHPPEIQIILSRHHHPMIPEYPREAVNKKNALIGHVMMMIFTRVVVDTEKGDHTLLEHLLAIVIPVPMPIPIAEVIEKEPENDMQEVSVLLPIREVLVREQKEDA